MRDQAHKMRGASGYLGGKLFAEIASNIEHLEGLDQENLLSFSEQVSQLKNEFSRLEIALKEFSDRR